MEEKEKTPSISRKESQLSDCSRCASSLRKIEVGLLIFCIVLLVAVSVLFYKVMKLEKDFSACQARTNFQPSRFPPPSAEPRTEPQRMDSPLKPTVISSRPTKPPTSSGRDGHSGSNNDQDGLPKVTHSVREGYLCFLAKSYCSIYVQIYAFVLLLTSNLWLQLQDNVQIKITLICIARNAS